jgi:hypothetical protein
MTIGGKATLPRTGRACKVGGATPSHGRGWHHGTRGRCIRQAWGCSVTSVALPQSTCASQVWQRQAGYARASAVAMAKAFGREACLEVARQGHQRRGAIGDCEAQPWYLWHTRMQATGLGGREAGRPGETVAQAPGYRDLQQGGRNQAGRSRWALLVLRELISTTKRGTRQPKCKEAGSTTRCLPRDQLPREAPPGCSGPLPATGPRRSRCSPATRPCVAQQIWCPLEGLLA